MNKSLDILELEAHRSELIEKVYSTSSTNLKVFLFFNYFGTVLSSNNQNLFEAFLKEFIEDYISTIQKFEVFGTNPEFTDKLLQQLKSLTSLTFIKNILPELSAEIERIAKQSEKLNFILEGKENKDGIEHKAFFPLIDKEAPDNFYGIIESVTIRINKAADIDKFIIVPSEKEIEKRILEQCKKSWIVALDLSREYIKKPYKYHEVILSFDKKEGFYEGSSLGTALTLSFLEELLKFYNPTYVIKIKERSAFTGGITETGEVLCTSEEIIKKKVTTIFFSEVNTFVVPKLEETYAYFALTQLKNQYPQRNLKLIPAVDIYDVLNRRDLVEIKKINPAVRTGKFVKKNWTSAAATVLLAILFGYLFVMDFDNNPYLIDASDGIINVKNKLGRILWNKNNSLGDEAINDHFDLQKYLVKIVDIDEDGKNEVLITSGSRNESIGEIKENALTCFNHNGKKIWDYTIGDTVYSYRKGDEILPPPYSIQIIDTVTIDNKKQLYLFCNNRNSFSSLIFGINLISGKRIAGTFYCSGHTLGAFIKDINNDGIKDIVAKGVDNGYNQIVLFGMSLENLKGFRKTIPEYSLRFCEEAELLFYIRLPKTDLDELKIGERFASKKLGGFWYDYTKQKIVHRSVFSMETPKLTATAIEYQLYNNFKDFDLIIFDEFRTVRDSLVAHGKLNLPYTDTPEYKNIIKSKILYYKGGKWVRREECD
jgi:hypothetical protein